MCGAGAIYMKECPVNIFVPIYLVVGGGLEFVTTFAALLESTVWMKNSIRQSTAFFKFWIGWKILIDGITMGFVTGGECYHSVCMVLLYVGCRYWYEHGS